MASMGRSLARAMMRARGKDWRTIRLKLNPLGQRPRVRLWRWRTADERAADPEPKPKGAANG